MPAAKPSVSVDSLLQVLSEDLRTRKLTHTERDSILNQLKVLGRDVNNINRPAFDQGIEILGGYGFGDYPRDTSREALRCIANALLLVPRLRETFVESGFDRKAADLLERMDDDDEFLASRILFLLTYESLSNFEVLISESKLAESINAQIARHAEQGKIGHHALVKNQMSVNALCETLKLLYNVINAKKQPVDRFNRAVPALLELLLAFPLTKPSLEPPITYLLNAMASLDFHQMEGSPETNGSVQVSQVEIEQSITILERATAEYSPSQLETRAIPLLTILRRMNQSPQDDIRPYMKQRLLPKDGERDVPLGKSSSLASSLLNLTTSAGLTQLPEAISSLLFEVSNSDATEYVHNVGYGYAAGYLMSHKIPIPESIKQSGTNDNTTNQIPINPVTGQRLDKEPRVSELVMTQEEKEREAERLFVLFERLRATGVVDVQNPVHQAMEEGRFEELSDSDSA